MKILSAVTESEVWDHWKAVENFSHDDFRSDIREPLPDDVNWHLAEIEPQDLDRLFIISSSDWTDISGGTFRVLDVASRLNLASEDENTLRIANDIKGKITFFQCGGDLDTKLIAVTNSTDSVITFIEGNRRSVVFAVNQMLVGQIIYIGISPQIKNYKWVVASFR
ncbi:hypothetical protein GMST_42930 [Geomonas silvestris]|uniref:Uncharacterized protein n=1 Tax=Geomonas silvestris TaxID=2740184 RepID=A0A6V8MPJ2_9BACT|nr:hypothetical protein [Geomonas silvestris]GFO61968.1 hypothetical protein GMST_42930 [Geomonas silvestris]